jgi:hypothetical protein
MYDPHRRSHGFEIGLIPLTLGKRTIDVMFGDKPREDTSNCIRHWKSFHEISGTFTIGFALTGIGCRSANFVRAPGIAGRPERHPKDRHIVTQIVPVPRTVGPVEQNFYRASVEGGAVCLRFKYRPWRRFGRARQYG